MKLNLLSSRLITDLWERLSVVVWIGLTLVIGGTFGYMWIEHWSWIDALYMTVITLSTVGYGEVQPLSQGGKFFSVGLIVLGVGTVAFTFSTVADYIIAGELGGVLRRERMLQDIKGLRNHYIVCGYGRVGRQVIEGLHADGFTVVVIEANKDRVAPLETQNIRYLIGDASDDAMLIEAGITHARGLCTCLPGDATNVFVTLSARTLNPEMFIIARSNVPSSENKLRIAGANQVINPYLIAGNRMAAQLVHPNVMEFLDVVMRRGELELHIEELLLTDHSSLAGKTLLEGNIRVETGVNVLAVARLDLLLTDLGDDFVMEAGDTLICLGTPEQLNTLETYIELT
ncbi:potassium channel protein [Chloroflexi bacterium TSY]|nr:potassium channel protein [Chloroflexi bacterium TSY]